MNTYKECLNSNFCRAEEEEVEEAAGVKSGGGGGGGGGPRLRSRYGQGPGHPARAALRAAGPRAKGPRARATSRTALLLQPVVEEEVEGGGKKFKFQTHVHENCPKSRNAGKRQSAQLFPPPQKKSANNMKKTPNNRQCAESPKCP